MRGIFLVLMSGFFSACATSQLSGPKPLDAVLQQSNVLALPYVESEAGLIYIRAKINGSKELLFLLDTGATRTSIFERTRRDLNLEKDLEKNVRIFGMIQSGVQPLVDVKSFEIGQTVFSDRSFALLDNLTPAYELEIDADGILGMDILSEYRLFRRELDKMVYLIPNGEAEPQLPFYWLIVPLNANPFMADTRHLKFMEIRLKGQTTPALLDTGAEYNIMNWDMEKFPTLRSLRRRMEKDWELKGAIGTFEPTTLLKFERFRSGQKFWDDQLFIVMHFESLDVLGIKDQPFAIGGISLFKGLDFYIDFEKNVLLLDERQEKDLRSRSQQILSIYPTESFAQPDK